MNKLMHDQLKNWLSKHSATIAETTGTHTCELKFTGSGIKRDISIAFTRYFHGDDPAEYVVGDRGLVVVLPAFWLSVNTELAVHYIEAIIDAYLAEYIYSAPKPVPGPPPPPSQVPVAVPGACCHQPPLAPAEQKPYGVRTEHGDIGVAEDQETRKLATEAAAHSNFVNIQKHDIGES